MTDAPAGVIRLDDLLARAGAAFRAVQERVFADDPNVNGNLMVEATEGAIVDGVPTLVLITPWTLNGLLLPCGDGPAELRIAGTTRRAFRGDVAPLGVYWAVNLVPDVSRLSGPRQARTLASSFAEPFRGAVRLWLASRAG
jgi:[NiFe]-hydrogenase assembly, chaperone, HybE